MKIPREPVVVMKDGRCFRDTAMVIPEEIFRVLLNDRPAAEIICRPENPEEPSIGILANHKLLSSPESIKNIQVHPGERVVSIEACVDLPEFLPLLSPEGSWTACGALPDALNSLAGNDEIPPRIDKPGRSTPKLAALSGLVPRFLDVFEVKSIFGAYQVAALADNRGRLLGHAGDVGMGVAEDRVFGRAFLEGANLKDKILLISGRLRESTVNKAFRWEIPVIVTSTLVPRLGLEAALARGIQIVHSREDGALTLFGAESETRVSEREEKKSREEESGFGAQS